MFDAQGFARQLRSRALSEATGSRHEVRPGKALPASFIEAGLDERTEVLNRAMRTDGWGRPQLSMEAAIQAPPYILELDAPRMVARAHVLSELAVYQRLGYDRPAVKSLRGLEQRLDRMIAPLAIVRDPKSDRSFVRTIDGDTFEAPLEFVARGARKPHELHLAIVAPSLSEAGLARRMLNTLAALKSGLRRKDEQLSSAVISSLFLLAPHVGRASARYSQWEGSHTHIGLLGLYATLGRENLDTRSALDVVRFEYVGWGEPPSMNGGLHLTPAQLTSQTVSNVARAVEGCEYEFDMHQDGEDVEALVRTLDHLCWSMRGILDAFPHQARQALIHGRAWDGWKGMHKGQGLSCLRKLVERCGRAGHDELASRFEGLVEELAVSDGRQAQE